MADCSIQTSLPSLSPSPAPCLSSRLSLLSLSHHPLLVPILAKLWQALHSHRSLHLYLDSQTYTAALKGIFATAAKVLDRPGQLSLWDHPIGTGVAFGRFCYDMMGIVGGKGEVEEVERRMRILFKACTESDNGVIRPRKDLFSCTNEAVASSYSHWLPVIREKPIESPISEEKRRPGWGKRREVLNLPIFLIGKRSKSVRPEVRKGEETRFLPSSTSIILAKCPKSPSFLEKSTFRFPYSL